MNAFASAVNKSLDEAVFAFIDVETTGLSPQTSRVLEVALICFQGGAKINQISSLINPGIPIPPEATQINGITEDMIRDSPSFGEVAPRLIDALEGSVLVAHNADFDISFLRMEFERAGLRFPDLPVVDTLCIARSFRSFSNNRLGTIARELDISAGNWHRALGDVEMTRKIFEHFMVLFKKDGAATVSDVVKKASPPSGNRKWTK